MIFVSYSMQCDGCTKLLPGIDNVLDTRFSNENVMYRQARKLDWLIWESFNEREDLVPTGVVKCPDCKGN